VINSRAILGGLHHHYARAQVFGTHNRRSWLGICVTRSWCVADFLV
jgi:hypothetical protein